MCVRQWLITMIIMVQTLSFYWNSILHLFYCQVVYEPLFKCKRVAVYFYTRKTRSFPVNAVYPSLASHRRFFLKGPPCGLFSKANLDKMCPRAQIITFEQWNVHGVVSLYRQIGCRFVPWYYYHSSTSHKNVEFWSVYTTLNSSVTIKKKNYCNLND